MPRTLLLTYALSLAACASARTSPPASPSPAPVTVAVDAGAAASPWAALATADLSRIVVDGARRDLAAAVPSFQFDRLAEYVNHPDQCPELPGRAVDRLLDLAAVQLANNRGSEAVGIVRLVRLRAVNRNTAFVGNTVLAEFERRRAGADPTAQERAIAAVFRELPPVRFNAATVFYQLFQRSEQLTARLDLVHRAMVSPSTARDALFFGVVAPDIVANRARYLAAIGIVRTENNARPPQHPYAFGTEDLAHATDAHEVRVAVWDLGTNPGLFAPQMLVDGAEPINGRDDDHDGRTDDAMGIVSDGNAPDTALLYDPGADTITQFAPYLRGVMDLRAGLTTTPSAGQVLALVRSVESAEAQRELDRKLTAIGEWAHGTHVAGILLAGVPQARLAVFRSAWAGEARVYEDRGPTDAELEMEHRNMMDVAGFIRRRGIRVVNASLGFSREYVEEQLRHESSRYHSDDEVRARAAEVQAHRKAYWTEVFAACPDTLFVVAAGNSNQDVVEYDDVPASIEAPNMLVVGAVDRFGDWAIFTNSNRARVRVFDLGVEVDSVIPNGEHMPLSGTSMASPNAANLAAKLLSVQPALAPAALIDLIVSTGDEIAAPFYGRIANETRALASVRAPRPSPPASARARPAPRAPAHRVTPGS